MKHIFLLGFVSIFSLIASSTVSALSITTEAEYIVGGSTILIDSASGPPPSTIGSLVTPEGSARAANFSGISAVRAESAYWGFASGSSDINELTANATFSDTYSNTSGVAQEFFYNFFVFAPSLEIRDWAGANNTMTGAPTVSYFMDILVDGSSVWSSSAVLNGGVNGHTLTETGVDLGGTAFGAGSVFGYNFNDYSDTISLGIFADGDSFSFETVHRVSVSALPYELGGAAFIGDPGDLGGTGSGGTVFSSGSSVPVPEPGIILLLTPSLAGLVLFRKKLKVRAVVQ